MGKLRSEIKLCEHPSAGKLQLLALHPNFLTQDAAASVPGPGPGPLVAALVLALAVKLSDRPAPPALSRQVLAVHARQTSVANACLPARAYTVRHAAACLPRPGARPLPFESKQITEREKKSEEKGNVKMTLKYFCYR